VAAAAQRRVDALEASLGLAQMAAEETVGGGSGLMALDAADNSRTPERTENALPATINASSDGHTAQQTTAVHTAASGPAVCNNTLRNRKRQQQRRAAIKAIKQRAYMMSKQ
jgi:hypothetical protein